MASYLLKLLLLSGKYLTQTAGRRLLHTIYTSTDLQNNLGNQYGKMACTAGSKHNVLKITSNRLEDLDFQKEEHVAFGSDALKIKPEIRKSFKCTGATPNCSTFMQPHAQGNPHIEFVSTDRIILNETLNCKKKKKNNRAKELNIPVSVKNVIKQNALQSNNTLQIEHKALCDIECTYSGLQKNAINNWCKEGKQIEPSHNNVVNIKQNSTHNIEKSPSKQENKAADFYSSLKEYSLTKVKQHEFSKLLTPTSYSFMQRSAQEKKDLKVILSALDKICKTDRQREDILLDINSDPLSNKFDNVKNYKKQERSYRLPETLNKKFLQDTCNSEITFCRCMAYVKENEWKVVEHKNINNHREKLKFRELKCDNIDLNIANTDDNVDYYRSITSHLDHIYYYKTRISARNPLTVSYSHYNPYSKRNLFHQCNCFDKYDMLQSCLNNNMYKQQKDNKEKGIHDLLTVPPLIMQALVNSILEIKKPKRQNLLNTETLKWSSLLNKNFNGVTENIKNEMQNETISNKNINNVCEIPTPQKINIFRCDIKHIGDFERSATIELWNMVKKITSSNLHLLFNQLESAAHILFVYSSIRKKPVVLMCTSDQNNFNRIVDSLKPIYLVNSERSNFDTISTFSQGMKQFTNGHVNVIGRPASKETSEVQKTKIKVNSFELLESLTQTSYLKHSGTTPLFLPVMPLTKDRFKQTNSTNFEKNDIVLKKKLAQTNLTEQGKHIKKPVKVQRSLTNNPFEQLLQLLQFSKRELERQLPLQIIREVTATQLKRLRRSKAFDSSEQLFQFEETPGNINKPNPVNIVEPLKRFVTNGKTRVTNFAEQFKQLNKVNLNMEEICMKFDGSSNKLAPLRNTRFLADATLLLENYKIENCTKLITTLQHISFSKIRRRKNINTILDDIKERTSIMEINKKAFDDLEKDIRKIKIIDKPKKKPGAPRKKLSPENVTNTTSSLKTVNNNQNLSTTTKNSLHKKQTTTSVCDNSVSTNLNRKTSSAKKLDVINTIQMEIKEEINLLLKKNEYNTEIMKDTTAELNEFNKPPQLIEIIQKEALIMVGKQLVEQIQAIYQYKTALIKSTNIVMPATLGWNIDKTVANGSQYNENNIKKGQTDVHKNIDLISENKTLSSPTINLQNSSEKILQQDEFNNSEQEKHPRAKNIYNRPPLYFRKHSGALILPETTFWNAQPKPLTINWDYFNKQMKSKNFFSKKYRYETKEVQSPMGDKIKITRLISDSDGQ